MNGLKLNSQFAKFIVTGFVSNGLSFLLFLFAVYIMNWEHKVSATLLFLLSMLINYIVNKRWTFQLKGEHLNTSAKFALTYLTGYLLNIAFLSIFVDRLHYPAGTVQFCAICFLVVYYYFLNKYFIFKH